MRVVRDANSEPSPSDDEDPHALARDGAAPLELPETPAAQALHALLSSARHDLRSPLQSIQGFAELLGSEAYGALSVEQRTFVTHILQGSAELGGVLDACMELAELELLGRRAELTRTDLRSALLDAVEYAKRRGELQVSLQTGISALGTSLRVHRDGMRRALEALLIAMATGDNRSFTVAIEVVGEHARLSVLRAGSRAEAGQIPYAELPQRRRITRNLLWFRLAGVLFASQEAALTIGERLDNAEVRVRISSTH